MSSGTLHEIGLKYQTDKSTYHQYMDFYENHLDRKSIKRFLEIGVQGGNSLMAWREWFDSDCHIEGWDINVCSPIDGCEIKIVDQGDRDQISKSISGIYDVILDDGAHFPRTIETSFSILFKHCRMYIIEDLHAWWLGYRNGETFSTVDLLRKISSDGWLSQYATNEEALYISRNAELVDIFYRGEESNPLSMTAIILNKENFHA